MRFSDFHPLVNLVWFLAVGGISVFYMNPLTSAFLLVSACIMQFRLAKSRFLGLLFPMMVVTAIVNPMFSHKGVTILAYFPSGNPLTLESIVYGVSAAIMLGAAVMLCIVFSKIFTADKLHYFIGRVFPSLAIILSMILRFVPRFVLHIGEAYNSRCTLLGVPSRKRDKIKYGAAAISASMTWSLENSLDVADSMKSRGWGIKGRTSFTRYRFEDRDRDALTAILVMCAYFISGIAYGVLDFRFYPTIQFAKITPFGVSCIIIYAFLCSFPLLLEVSHGKIKN